jgi:hypothetical protein
LLVGLDRESAPIICAGTTVNPLRREFFGAVAEATRNFSVDGAAQDCGADHCGTAFELAQVDQTSGAGRAVSLNGLQNCKTSMQPADIVVPRIRNRRGRFVFRPGDHHQSAVSLEIHVHASPMTARTLMTISRHTDIDQRRIAQLERLVAKCQALHYTGAEILNNYVRNACEFARELLPFRVFQVDRDGAFAAVGVEIRRMASIIANKCRGPGMVRMFAAFHANDIRAQIGE